jgi:ribosome maturation factor RimP
MSAFFVCGREKAAGQRDVYRDIPEELRVLIEPIIEDAGFELVDIVENRGRRPWLMRCVIDTRAGDGRVPVERCAVVSREIETHLDATDAISASYQLEVSSPGLDRPLAREKDFVAACGSEVRVETRRTLNGRRRFRGRLVDFDGKTARVEVDGSEIAIDFDDIAKANSIYEFTRDDFVGRAGLR